jgi:phosphonate transport system substrate-binding protein
MHHPTSKGSTMARAIRRTLRDLFFGSIALVLCSLIAGFATNPAHAADKIRFAVGPFQPTPGDTKKAYEPFFEHLAKAMEVEYDLVVTTDWAGIATALANGQADVAWMGPWGYVLANKEGDAQAIATVKYDGKPVYHAIIVGRPELKIGNWPDDAKGLSISFADRGFDLGMADSYLLVHDQGHRSQDVLQVPRRRIASGQ